MARPGTQEQPTVEEMLVSIRQAIHGENAKTRSTSRSPSSPPKPPAVSGSMRQMRVSMKSNPTKTQSSVRTHSDNFQKLKRQLHDLDPLLGKQGRKSGNEYRASTANGFAGILNGDVKLEEALAKLERAGLGDVQPESRPEPRPEPVQPSSPAPQPQAQLRGTESYEDESYEDEFDEYDFDPTSYDEPEVRQDVRVEQQFQDYDDVTKNYDTQTPPYIQRAPAANPIAPQVSAPIAPPVATAPLAPPLVRTPSYGYDELVPDVTHQESAQLEQSYSQPTELAEPTEQIAQRSLPPLPETMVRASIEQPVRYQPVAQPNPVQTSQIAVPARQARTVAPVANTGLTSPEHARAASDAFASLAETIMHQATTGNRSIDDITKELLNPMLKGWLDENLPRMVERLIREEIERVARGGAR